MMARAPSKLDDFMQNPGAKEMLDYGMAAVSVALLALPEGTDMCALERAADNIRPNKNRAKVKAARRANNRRKQLA